PYVTLSHCWGGKVFTRLLKKLLPSFQKKLPLNELPRTFRDAIHFTRRLNSDIRYIWIDSLCIVQDDDEDWNSEAAQMYEVYTNSYCNISATAAKNSEEGLFFSRSPQQLWGDEINLNTEGIPKARTRELGNQTLGHEPLIRRCDILDMSFWEREVDKAPVNVRGWVLQERLLPPRVLHFCKHQIAWECRCLDAAEQFAHGVPSMGLQVGNVEQRSSLKSLLPDIHSRRPVSSILSEVSDAAHERWKKVVERFLKTGLTKEKDKLIALAGIAELMSNQIRGRYIAGMWEKYLPSQLLWYVEPVYDNGLLSYPSRRPAYRAPSFSWASID
ncbi:HET-domain-containing protein, partial [Tothia fuscella]